MMRLAAALLRKHDRLDPKRVVILGHSLGGTLAPRIGRSGSCSCRPSHHGGRYTATSGRRTRAAHLPRVAQSGRSQRRREHQDAGQGRTGGVLEGPRLLQSRRDCGKADEADVDPAARTRLPKSRWRISNAGERPERQVRCHDQELSDAQSPFHAGEGKSTPSEYEKPGHIPDFVLDDIAAWIRLR